MTFNHNVLFIHFGKAGGMSVSHYLCNTLKPPVIQTMPHAHIERTKPTGYELRIDGRRHENLPEAKEFLHTLGIDLQDFELIFAVVRNPIEMEYSLYNHLRKQKVIERAMTNNRSIEALRWAQKPFDTFAKTPITHRDVEVSSFFTVDGKVPPNYQVVRFEKMQHEIPQMIAPFSKNQIQFPCLNTSPNKPPMPQISDEAKQNIRKKYSWIYALGLYD